MADRCCTDFFYGFRYFDTGNSRKLIRQCKVIFIFCFICDSIQIKETSLL